MDGGQRPKTKPDGRSELGPDARHGVDRVLAVPLGSINQLGQPALKTVQLGISRHPAMTELIGVVST
jgi:hypothetical protein